jgi:hypothetical protein
VPGDLGSALCGPFKRCVYMGYEPSSRHPDEPMV